MRVLIAPNAMKGSIDAATFAALIDEALCHEGFTDTIQLPLADGGDGTAKILANYFNADFVPVEVLDPLNRKIQSGFYFDGKETAIIEMADASGLKLIDRSEYSATNTTSFGTGQLIHSAIKAGATKLIVGIGGSATVDGGMGALSALGVRFYKNGEEVLEGNGLNTGDVTFIDFSKAEELFRDRAITFLNDVANPLIGVNGAARVFAPQKGATVSEIEILEKNLALFAGVLFQSTGIDISKLPGGGAAGGIAASFHALFGAELIEGAQFIIEKSGFQGLASSADLIITGEGCVDETSLMGKATGEVLKIGNKLGKPVFALCGANRLHHNSGFAGIFSLTSDGTDENEAIRSVALLIKKKTLDLIHSYTI